MFTTRVRLYVWGLIFGLLAPAFAGAASITGLQPVKLQLKWTHQFQFAGFYAAIEQGYFREAGLDVQLIEGRSGVDFIREVTSGRADYGVEMPDLLLRRNAGEPVVVLAVIFQHSPIALISLAQSGINSPHDLVGRRVMLRSAGNDDLRAMIVHEGVALSRIKFSDHSFKWDDLVEGKTDAMSSYWTASVYELQQRGLAVNVLEPIKYGIDFYGDCLFTSERELSQSPSRVRAFREATLRGWLYAMEHQEAMAQLIHAKYAPKKTVEALLAEAKAMESLLQYRLVEIGHMNPGRWRHIGDTYAKLGMLPANYSLEGFLYNAEIPADLRWLKWLALLSACGVVTLGVSLVILWTLKRKEAFEQLRASEQFTQATLDALAAHVCVLDNKGVVTAVNRAWRDFGDHNTLGGRSVQPGESYLQVCDRAAGPNSDEAPVIAHGIRDVIAGKRERFVAEYPCHSPAEEHWFVLRVSPFPEAPPRRVVLAHSDITQHKRAAAALAVSEKKYRQLVETTGTGYVIVDEQGRVLDANHEYLRLTGRPGWESVLGRPVLEWTAPQDRERNLQSIKQCLAEGFVRNFEVNYLTPAGALVPVEVNASVLRETYPLQLLALCRDITSRKRAQDEQFRLLTALQQAAETIVITDPQGVIEYVNPAFERTTGYTRAEVTGQTPRIFKSGKHDADHYRRMWETIKQGQTWQGRFVNRRKDGTIYEEEGTISPVRSAAGDIVNFVAVKRDVTREVQLETQLRQAQKLDAIGQLAGGVAHDYNNILAAMIMNLELIQEQPDLDPGVRSGLHELDSAAQRAAALTRQLLMFSRRSVLEIRTLDLNDVVANLLKMLVRLVGEQIQFAFEPGASLPAVSADAGMLEQVIMNLVVNARDALLPRGGRLDVSTQCVEISAEQAALQPHRRSGCYVCLTVADTGCGMDEATLQRIFEPFFTTKEKGKGTGLGLATAYGIVSQHKGWIEVESQLGHGATFRVFLPATGQLPAKKSAPKPPPAPKGTETIMVVEDDPHVRSMVVRSLQTLGYHVLEAANGPEALRRWRIFAGNIDLLLTDMVMPHDMTGAELAQQIRAEKPDLKVIISSGYSEEIVQAGGSPLPGVVYLPKPYQHSHLGKLVRDCLDKKG